MDEDYLNFHNKTKVHISQVSSLIMYMDINKFVYIISFIHMDQQYSISRDEFLEVSENMIKYKK